MPAPTERDAAVQETAKAMLTVQSESLRGRMRELKAGKPPGGGGVSVGVDEDGRAFHARLNPFSHHDRIDAWEATKMAVGVVVVPLRMMAFCFLAVVLMIWMRITMIGQDRSKPMSWFRYRVLQQPAYYATARLAFFVLGVVRIRIKGKLDPTARVVVGAPHSSWLDGMLLAMLTNAGSAVGKAEVVNAPAMGWLMAATQSVAVDRNSKEGKRGALQAIIDRVSSPLPWRPLFLFPEGTCTNRRALITFKQGAFAAGVPVQPVLFRWPFANFDPAWTSGGPNRLYLVYRFLSQVYVTVDVEFLPLYKPSEDEKKDAALYASGVRTVMAEALGVPTTAHSYEDSFLARQARKMKLEPDALLPYEFVELNKLFNVTYKDAQDLLRRFGDVKRRKIKGESAVGTGTTGGDKTSPMSSVDESLNRSRLNLPEFAALLGVPLTEQVAELFTFFDVVGDGYVDFVAFVVGLAFISNSTSLEEAARIVWRAVDRDDAGVIEMKRVRRVLDLVFKRSGAQSKRPFPLFKELESKGIDKVSFEQFLEAARKHPEYIPLGLAIVALPVQDRALQHLSMSAAVMKKNEKERLLAASPAPGAGAGAASPGKPAVTVAGNLPDRHTSFAPKDALEVEEEQKLS